MFVHGIDEAGYGPLLGPLVLGRADFETNSGKVRLPLKKCPSVHIADSKQLLSRKNGFAQLEASVLGIYACVFGRPPESLQEWLSLDTQWHEKKGRDLLPWYQDSDLALPLKADADDVTLAWEACEKGKAFRGGRPVGLSLRVTDETHLNRLWDASGNKHDSLFTQVAELMEEALGGEEKRRFHVDKLGGRSRYEPKLVGAFPFVPIEVVKEDRSDGHYRLDHADGPFDVSFHVKGDDRFCTISLASMLAKYTRELLMDVFNEYWREVVPEIEPTAGYYQDGNRFLADLDAAGALTPKLKASMMRRR